MNLRNLSLPLNYCHKKNKLKRERKRFRSGGIHMCMLMKNAERTDYTMKSFHHVL